MTSIARNFARFVAVPAIVGGAALGLAGIGQRHTRPRRSHHDHRACTERPRLPVLPGRLRHARAHAGSRLEQTTTARGT